MVDLVRELRTAMRTGKVVLGSKRTLALIKLGKAKLVIIADNCPLDIRSDIEYYCKLADIPIYIFPGTSWDLGAVCGKPFMVASLCILDPGESDIMALVEKEEEE